MNLEVKPALHDPNALDDLISLCSDLCVFALNVALFVNSFLNYFYIGHLSIFQKLERSFQVI